MRISVWRTDMQIIANKGIVVNKRLRGEEMQIHLKIRLKEDVYFLWVNFGFFKTEVKVCERCNFRLVKSDYEVLKATTCWDWLKWVTIGRVKRLISKLKVKAYIFWCETVPIKAAAIRNWLKQKKIMFIRRLFRLLIMIAYKVWKFMPNDSFEDPRKEGVNQSC